MPLRGLRTLAAQSLQTAFGHARRALHTSTARSLLQYRAASEHVQPVERPRALDKLLLLDFSLPDTRLANSHSDRRELPGPRQ